MRLRNKQLGRLTPGGPLGRSCSRTTVWFGASHAVLNAAGVRFANLPGGRFCSPWPLGRGLRHRGIYWCCWPTMNDWCDPCVRPEKFCKADRETAHGMRLVLGLDRKYEAVPIPLRLRNKSYPIVFSCHAMSASPLERFPLGLNWDSQGAGKGGVLAGDSVSGMRHDQALFGGFAGACG